jgi:CheY-like chemotaxis protein
LIEVLVRFVHLASLKDDDSTPTLTGTEQHDIVSGVRALRILLAEDNPVNQRVVTGILEKRGHDVVAVRDGNEAVRAAQGGRFDIILMDVQMPEMDGLEATVLIRESEHAVGSYTPIVALTARAMKGDRECCLAAGMDGYLSKPIQPRELLKTIDELMAPASPDWPPKATCEDEAGRLLRR